MSEIIKKSDISEKDIYGYVIASAKNAEIQVNALNNELRESAKLNADNIKKNSKLSNTAEIKATENAIKLSNIQLKEKLKLENDLIKFQADKLNAETKLRNATEKSTQSVKDQTNAYKKLVVETRDLKNESKRLGAELLHLESVGKKNTREYALLEKQYKQTTSQAFILDGQLKKLDSKVGDNFRNVGNYSKAIGSLKNMMMQLGLGFGVFEGIKFLAGTEIKLQSLQLALKNVMGSTQEYTKAFQFLTDLSKDYGQDLIVLTDTYKNFIASSNSSGLAIEERNKIYQSIIKSGSSLALSNEQIEGSLLAVSQMFSKGKVSAEELRGQLAERLTGAFGIMAKSMGVSEMQLDKMLKNGEVLAKDVLPKFAVELEKTFGANAKKNLETIGGAWNVLKTNISLYVNEANEGGKATKAIAGAISFLAKNLDSIVSVLGLVIKTYITYKGVMLALNLKDQIIRNWNKFRGTIAENATALTDAEKSASKFGSTIKDIGIAILIEQVLEATWGFYEMATGIDQARTAQENFNKAVKNGQKFGSDIVSKLNKEIDLGTKSKEQAKERIKFEIQTSNENKDIAKERIKQIEKELSLTSQWTSPLRFRRLTERLNIQKNVIAEENTIIKEMILFSTDLDTQTKIATTNTEKSTKVLKDHKDAVSDTEKAYREYLKTRKELSLEDWKKPELQFADIEKADEDVRNRKRAIAQIHVLDAELSKNQKAIRRAKINQIMEELDAELENIEHSNPQREVLEKEAQLKIQEIEKESLMERFQTMKEFVDLSLDYFIKQSEKKIAQIDKEISASEKQSEILEQLAINGNITAQQSLVVQQQITQKANNEKIKEQKRIENLKALEQAYDIYGTNLEKTGDPKQALLQTVTDIQSLKLLLSLLPSYKDGIEDTGPQGKGVDGIGGFHAILHPNERVVNEENNQKMKGISNDELGNLAQSYKMGKVINLKKQDHAGNTYDLALLNEMKGVRNAIKNIPTSDVRLGEIYQGFMQIIETRKTGNKTTRDTFNIRK